MDPALAQLSATLALHPQTRAACRPVPPPSPRGCWTWRGRPSRPSWSGAVRWLFPRFGGWHGSGLCWAGTATHACSCPLLAFACCPSPSPAAPATPPCSLVKKDAGMLDAFGKGASSDIQLAKQELYAQAGGAAILVLLCPQCATLCLLTSPLGGSPAACSTSPPTMNCMLWACPTPRHNDQHPTPPPAPQPLPPLLSR